MVDTPLVITYPMKAVNRMREFNYDLVHTLLNQYEDPRYLDFTRYHFYHLALEGTGVLIFDVINRSVYANV